LSSRLLLFLSSFIRSLSHSLHPSLSLTPSLSLSPSSSFPPCLQTLGSLEPFVPKSFRITFVPLICGLHTINNVLVSHQPAGAQSATLTTVKDVGTLLVMNTDAADDDASSDTGADECDAAADGEGAPADGADAA
jgi:hypothetical protein